MLIRSSFVGHEDSSPAGLYCYFKVEDTCFKEKIKLWCPRPSTYKSVTLLELAAIIYLYQKRHLNVAKNISLYYKNFGSKKDMINIINSEAEFINTYFPHLEYHKIQKSVINYFNNKAITK